VTLWLFLHNRLPFLFSIPTPFSLINMNISRTDYYGIYLLCMPPSFVVRLASRTSHHLQTGIWRRTHRHPQSAVPSMCSLVKAVHQVYYEKDCKDDAALGRAICDISADHLLKTPANIEASKLDCAHVIYNDLIRDPVSVVRAIYSQFGWEISPEYLQALNAYLEENRQQREAIKTKREKGGGEALHTYTAEEFSLTDKELESGKFAEYVAKFNVPASRG
jgi:hypothetical protein